MSDFTNGAHECFCDRKYKDADKLASCGDCPRDYIAGAWDARRKYIEEHSKKADHYEEWRNFYAEKVRSWMSLDELRAECGKLQTVDNPSPEVLLIHAMHALEEREQRDEALLREAMYALEYASDMTKPDDLQECDCTICASIAALRARLEGKTCTD